MSKVVLPHGAHETQIVVRPAEPGDARAIAVLLNRYAKDGLVLPRTEEEVLAELDSFGVCMLDDVLAGCTALHVYSSYLAEIRSLAVREAAQRHGIGAHLVEWCIRRAIDLGIDRVFALTYRARFFERLGFSMIQRTSLPEKIWADCSRCPKAQFCDEVALVLDIVHKGDNGPFQA